MRVLLISPLPQIDPACGDVTYTQTLLAHPPDGVKYETYAEALARGALVEHGSGRSLRRALASGINVGTEAMLTAITKSMNGARNRRWLFWEPNRFFSVRPGEYDLVHLHVFNARFLKLPCPLVVSNGAPQRYLYTELRGYSRRRTELIESVETAVARAMGINQNSYHLPQATRTLVYTDFLRDWYIKRRIVRADRLDIVPIFLPTPSGVAPFRNRLPRRVGFVAKDFEAKGGPTLVKAFETVRLKRPDVELHIVGCSPRFSSTEAAARGIVWTPYVERSRLLNEVLPSFDVFAYPTHCDCISYVFLEAMSQGIALATSDYPSMPEAVDYGRSGLVSPVGNPQILAENILKLLDPDVNCRFGAAAGSRFRAHYSADAVRPKLLRSYQAAVAGVN